VAADASGFILNESGKVRDNIDKIEVDDKGVEVDVKADDYQVVNEDEVEEDDEVE
jgi:hypothetical protein